MAKIFSKSIAEKIEEELNTLGFQGVFEKKLRKSKNQIDSLISEIDNYVNGEEQALKNKEQIKKLQKIFESLRIVIGCVSMNEPGNSNSFNKWHDEILNQLKKGTPDELSKKIRPFSQNDFSHRRETIFSFEERDFLDKLHGKNLGTLMSNLTIDPSTKELTKERLYKQFMLLIFFMAVFNLELKGDFLEHQPEFETYWCIYDRSFVEDNDFGLIEISIINNFWAKVQYFYINNEENFVAFARIENFGANGILNLKNFVEPDSKSKPRKPYDNFMLLTKQGGKIKGNSLMNADSIMVGYSTSINRRYGFLYSTTVIAIKKEYFISNFKSILPEENLKLLLDANKKYDANKFWEQIKKDKTANLIAPIYYFLFHQSLTLRHVKNQLTNSGSIIDSSENVFKTIEDIPYYNESKLLQSCAGYYRGFNLVQIIRSGENSHSEIVVTGLKIDLSGQAQMYFDARLDPIGTDFKFDKIRLKNDREFQADSGFVKSIGLKKDFYSLILAFRYNYKGHYYGLHFNLEFKPSEGEKMNVGELICGTMATNSIYTHKPIATRIVFEKVESDKDIEPIAIKLTHENIAQRIKNRRIIDFFNETHYDNFTDAAAIQKFRSEWNKEQSPIIESESPFAGEYWVFVCAKESSESGQFIDKIPSLYIHLLTIEKNCKAEYNFGKIDSQGHEISANGIIEDKGGRITYLLRVPTGEDLFTISFRFEGKFDYCYGILTSFANDHKKPESYLILIWKKTKNSEVQNNWSIKKPYPIYKSINSTPTTYNKMIELEQMIPNPEIDEIDKETNGHLKFLIGTENFRMIRSPRSNQPKLHLKFDEHRRIYFESAMFNLLNANSIEKAKIAIIKAHQQGFASLYYAGKKLEHNSIIPVELKEDYKLFLKFKTNIEQDTSLKKIVENLWGKDAFEIMEKFTLVVLPNN